MATANPFAGLPSAQVFGKGNYLAQGGEYVISIEGMEYKDLFKGGSALIVEFEVVESNNDKDPVGSKRSWFQSKNASFGGAVLEFLYAVLGTDYKNDPAAAAEVQKASADLMQAALEKNEFKGQKVRVSTSHKLTKEAKKDFTVHVWTPYTEAA